MRCSASSEKTRTARSGHDRVGIDRGQRARSGIVVAIILEGVRIVHLFVDEPHHVTELVSEHQEERVVPEALDQVLVEQHRTGEVSGDGLQQRIHPTAPHQPRAQHRCRNGELDGGSCASAGSHVPAGDH